MKYGIIKTINGNYYIHAEGITDLSAAKTQFHGLCQVLWNAPDVLSAHVMIVNEQFNCVEGYKEFIHHDPVSAPEPEPEPESEGDGE
jgi:hypothetical protein